MQEHDKCFTLVEWSGADQGYVGCVPGWLGKCYHGDDECQVFQELCTMLDEWLELYKQASLALAIKALGAEERLIVYCQKILK